MFLFLFLVMEECNESAVLKFLSGSFDILSTDVAYLQF